MRFYSVFTYNMMWLSNLSSTIRMLLMCIPLVRSCLRIQCHDVFAFSLTFMLFHPEDLIVYTASTSHPRHPLYNISRTLFCISFSLLGKHGFELFNQQSIPISVVSCITGWCERNILIYYCHFSQCVNSCPAISVLKRPLVALSHSATM